MTEVIVNQPTEPPLPTPKGRRRGRLVLIISLVVVVLLAGGVIAFVTINGKAGRDLSTTGSPASTVADPHDIARILQRQGTALVNGDKAGWLAPVDPNQRELIEQFTRYFDALRAMKVLSWQALIDPKDLDEMYEFAKKGQLPKEFYVEVYFGYCWQTPTCPTAATKYLSVLGAPTEAFHASTGWRLINDEFTLTAFQPRPLPNSVQNLPWLSTSLRSEVGDRVTVFVDRKSSVDLKAVLAEAERAAKVTDSYAHWIKPSRYVVYIAGGPQWTSWFKGPLESSGDELAYAIETSQSSDAVVLNYNPSRRVGLDTVLRHEFGHVVTRLGAPLLDEAGLFVEGIAEFIQHSGEPLSTYDRRLDVREYFRSSRFDGNLDSLSVYGDDFLSISAAYGAGFYLWRCIQSTYGETRMWDFVTETVRYNPDTSNGPVDGAPKALGVSWTEVKKVCTTFIRRSY